MYQKMDISAGSQTSLDIFKLIIDEGPLTLYSANTKSRFPLGTIHRHFKEMERSGKIKSYKNSDRRKKKPYGPTFFGFVYYSRLDRSIYQKLENYFLLWTESKDFLDDLQNEGFDLQKIKTNPKKTKMLFRKYVEYGMGVEDQLDALKRDPSSIPREILVFIGELLIVQNPKYSSLWRDLYVNLPGLRKNINSYLQNMIAVQKELSKKIRH